jgi:3-hydroxymyristoyl/3-hydroxydecanoyl-(acyl carrier protein) dehydratase
MDEHFRAFSFVDQITSVQPGGRIRGRYAIPAGLDTFSPSLAAEAVGQLAAWSAMAALNFERRPVAGLAGCIELLSPVRPGQTLELAADLESVDAEAVAYSGTATADGVAVVRLQDCVGPMVLLNDFDDPQALRDRFAVLCGPGAEPGGFGGIPALALDRTDGERGRSARATFQVPASAPLFADHFPRRPVFPGTLLIHVNLQLAAALATEMPPPPGGQWTLRAIRDVKLRAFIPPGELLELEAKLNECSSDSATMAMEIRKGQKNIGGARVVLGRKESP